MIDDLKTFEKFGYWASELLPSSNKKVIAYCEGCRKERVRIRKGMSKFCASCSHKEYAKNNPQKKGKDSPYWRGGPPKCGDCGKQLVRYDAKLCKSCGRKRDWQKEEYRNSHIKYGKEHPCYGMKHSDKARAKMSEARKGVPKSKEHAKKIGLAHRGKVVSKETREKLRYNMLGKKHTEEAKKKIGDFMRSSHPWQGRKHSEETKKKLSRVLRAKKLNVRRGPAHPHWKGGISPLSLMVRATTKNRDWREAVFQASNFSCTDCGERGGYLEAHHIRPFCKIFREFLQKYNQFSPIEDKETLARLSESYSDFWDLDNGRTLCKKCHKKYKKGAYK